MEMEWSRSSVAYALCLMRYALTWSQSRPQQIDLTSYSPWTLEPFKVLQFCWAKTDRSNVFTPEMLKS
jgi:hypothetical protein